jgi:hypothetical protein
MGDDPFMEYVIDLDPTHLVLRVTVTGVATDSASREAYASLSHFATGGPYALILDMSGVTGNQLSTETIRDLAAQPPAVPGGRPRVVVAPRPEDYGVVRMFELLRDGMGGLLHPVLSVDEAYDMLGVSPEDFSQRLFPEQLAA